MKLLDWTTQPSQTKRLAARLGKGELVESFLASIVEFLNEVRLDGGAVDDLVVTTAMELTSAGVWQSINAKDLASRLKDNSAKVVDVFLRGVPDDFARKVRKHRPSSGPLRRMKIYTRIATHQPQVQPIINIIEDMSEAQQFEFYSIDEETDYTLRNDVMKIGIAGVGTVVFNSRPLTLHLPNPSGETGHRNQRIEITSQTQALFSNAKNAAQSRKTRKVTPAPSKI